ncbi:MAG TPA: hypothetical protein VHL78_02395, partial [Actinomycetota bacterium]|nr:hypothetical protein [Actinomycetota bacterium]
LLPVGLLALGAVRSVVMEPAGGTRPDGVIAAIRRRNLERRGAPLAAAGSPLGNAVGALGRGVTRTGRSVARAAARVRRSVGKR